MRKVNLKKILSLLLCFMLIAPVFGGYGGFDSGVSAFNRGTASQITSFGVIYRGDERGAVNILDETNDGQITLRGSLHSPAMSGGDDGDNDIYINITDIMMGNSYFENATVKLVFMNSGGAELVRGDIPVYTLSGHTGLFRVSGSSETFRIRPAPDSRESTVIMQIWVTHLGVDAAGNLEGAARPEPGSSMQQPENDSGNFTVKEITINIVNDEDDIINADLFLGQSGAVRLGDEPFTIAPPDANAGSGAETERVIRFGDVNISKFEAPNNRTPLVNYQWRVSVYGTSVEVEVNTGTRAEIIYDETKYSYPVPVFNQAARSMTVRARRETAGNGGDAEVYGHSGRSAVIIEIKRPADDNWQNITNSGIIFDVAAGVSFELGGPVLAAPGRTGTGSLVAWNDVPEGLRANDYYGDSYVRIFLKDLTVTDEDGVPRSHFFTIAMSGLDELCASVTVARSAEHFGGNDYGGGIAWERQSQNSSNMTADFYMIKDGFADLELDINLLGEISLYIPFDWMSAANSVSLKVEIKGKFRSRSDNEPETRLHTFARTANITRIDGDMGGLNGDFVVFEFNGTHKSGDYSGEPNLAPGNAPLVIEMDREGNFETEPNKNRQPVRGSTVVLDGFSAEVYDIDSYTLTNPNFGAGGIMITDIIFEPSNQKIAEFKNGEPFPSGGLPYHEFTAQNSGYNELVLTGEAGTVTVAISAKPLISSASGRRDAVYGKEITRKFSILVVNIGVFAADEGNVESAGVKKLINGNNKITIPAFSGDNAADSDQGGVYLKSGGSESSENVMTVNINDVIVLTRNASAASGWKNTERNFDVYIRLHGDPGAAELFAAGTGGLAESDRRQPLTSYPVVLPGLTEGGEYCIIESAGASGASFDVRAVHDGEAVVEAVIVPMAGTGENREWPGDISMEPAAAEGSFSPLTVYFKIIINELGGIFDLVIDHSREVLMIELLNDGGIVPRESAESTVFYNFNGHSGGFSPVLFMYTLRASADGSSQKNEKWLPVMGSEIDISGLIPKSGAYRIAVRLADAKIGEDGFFAEGARRMKTLGTRRTISANEKKNIVYSDGAIRFNGDGTLGVLYRVGGISEWADAVLTRDGGISISSEHHPLGGTAEIKFSDDSAGENKGFVSSAFKIKIPKAAKAPAIRTTGSGDKIKLSGLSNKLSWSSGDGSYGEWVWYKCPKGAVPYNSENLRTMFPNLISPDGSGYYELYLRVDAVINANTGAVRSHASAPVVFRIPASVYDGY